VVGNAEDFQELLNSGAASHPSGMTLPREKFPVVVDGWPPRN
jgi:hypothetical protein